MGYLDRAEKAEGRVLNVFFLLDTSGSMSGQRIAAVNRAVDESLRLVQKIQDDNIGQTIKVSILSFGNAGVNWMYDKPEAIDDFFYQDLYAGGLTPFGEACRELESKLHKNAYMGEAKASYAPAFILISDGAPTDDWESEVDKLHKNGWFKHGVRIAIAIDDATLESTLTRFTGNQEAVITTQGIDQLSQVIRLVSVTASKVSSSIEAESADSSNDATADAAEKISEAMADDADDIDDSLFLDDDDFE